MCFIGKYSQNVFKDLIRPKVTMVIVFEDLKCVRRLKITLASQKQVHLMIQHNNPHPPPPSPSGYTGKVYLS